MQKIHVNELPKYKFAALIQDLPFLSELINDSEQFNFLMQYAHLHTIDPGDVIIERGDATKMFFFVLSGRVAVYLQDLYSLTTPVGYLLPGELFGALAMLKEEVRNASIICPKPGQRCLLISIDPEPFGELEDFKQIKLQTKIILFKVIAERTLFRLNLLSKQFSDYPVAGVEDLLDKYAGNSGGISELKYWSNYAKKLADLITRWNLSLDELHQFNDTEEMSKLAPKLDVEIDELLKSKQDPKLLDL